MWALDRRDLMAAAGVAAVVGWLTISLAACTEGFWHDAIEFVAIANAWVNGAGFVDPVKWTYYLDSPAPFPAFSLRPPLPVALISLPLALGLSLPILRACLAFSTSLVIGGLVLLARRMMSLPAAVACGLMIGLSNSWLVISAMPLSDLIAIGAMLLVFATARDVSRSVMAALSCSVATLLGWATRPTIALLVGPIVIGVVWAEGPRAALRSRALALYLTTTLVGYLAIRRATVALTGFAPYEGYGFMSEMLSMTAPLSYGTKYVGSVTFITTWLPWIARTVLVRARELSSELFVVPRHSHVGWIALPGIVFCLLWRDAEPGRAALRRLVALSSLMFAVLTIITYAAFDPYRYPLPIAVCGALCGFAWLDDVLGALARFLRARTSDAATPLARWGVALTVGATLALPLTLVAVSFVSRGGVYVVQTAAFHWGEVAAGRTAPPEANPERASIRSICRRIRRGAVVAARDPWMVHAWCGNPAIMLPIDLGDHPQLQQAFWTHEKPIYVLYDGASVDTWLAASPYLQPVAGDGALVLYEVRESGPRRVTWRQPPPLMCAGRGESCLRAVGR